MAGSAPKICCTFTHERVRYRLIETSDTELLDNENVPVLALEFSTSQDRMGVNVWREVEMQDNRDMYAIARALHACLAGKGKEL